MRAESPGALLLALQTRENKKGETCHCAHIERGRFRPVQWENLWMKRNFKKFTFFQLFNFFSKASGATNTKSVRVDIFWLTKFDWPDFVDFAKIFFSFVRIEKLSERVNKCNQLVLPGGLHLRERKKQLPTLKGWKEQIGLKREKTKNSLLFSSLIKRNNKRKNYIKRRK